MPLLSLGGRAPLRPPLNTPLNFTLEPCQNFKKHKFHVGALAFHQSVKMHISKTLKKTWPLKFKSAKSMHFTYILNIDIDIAIFCKYRIDIVSKFEKWHRSITIRWSVCRVTHDSQVLRQLTFVLTICRLQMISTWFPACVDVILT